MVEEVTESHYSLDDRPPEITALVNAAHTPPFLTERRVVVGRNVAIFSKADQVKGLVEWLESPLDTTDLILVWEKGTTSGARMNPVPKSLKEALKKSGATEIDAAPKGKGRKMLLDAKLAESAVRFDASAKRVIADRLGDDVGRADAIVSVLVSTFGEGAAVTASDVLPFLGAASDIPPWDLTDAIDSGDIADALDKMHRMTRGGERHALQVMATLHGHYQKALALDGSGVSDERAAADHLGMKGSTFPAKKALNLTRQLGPDKTKRVIEMLAQADLDLRGGSAIESEAIMEILVARLARLSV